MNIDVSVLLRLLCLAICVAQWCGCNDIYESVLADLGDYVDPRFPQIPTVGEEAKEAVVVDAGVKRCSDNMNLLIDCEAKLSACTAIVCPSDGIPYFKQFIRSFVEALKPLEGEIGSLGTKVVLRQEQYDELQGILQKKEGNAIDILDQFNQYNAFQPLESVLSVWSNFFSNFTWSTVVGVFAACIIMACIMFFLMHLFQQDGQWINWRRQLIVVLFACFLCSIPWEWYRMYRVELSKKASMILKDIPAECYQKDITVWKSLSLYYRNTFTFANDKCAEYQESLFVDPVWEVSPLQATSVCISRFLLKPMKEVAATMGVCFKLFFNEIPLQWQPFIFISLVIVILVFVLCINGIKIEFPFFKIHFGGGLQTEIQYPRAQRKVEAAPHPALEHVENLPIENENQGTPHLRDNTKRINPPPLRQRRRDIQRDNGGIIEVRDTEIPVRPQIAFIENNVNKPSGQPIAPIENNIKMPSGQQIASKQNNLRTPSEGEDIEGGNINAAISVSTEISREPLEHQEQGDEHEEAFIIRSLPSESEYYSLSNEIVAPQLHPAIQEIQPMQEQEDLPSKGDASRNALMRQSIGESSTSNVVIPSDSSVFSMPLSVADSVGAVPETLDTQQPREDDDYIVVDNNR